MHSDGISEIPYPTRSLLGFIIPYDGGDDFYFGVVRGEFCKHADIPYRLAVWGRKPKVESKK